MHNKPWVKLAHNMRKNRAQLLFFCTQYTIEFKNFGLWPLLMNTKVGVDWVVIPSKLKVILSFGPQLETTLYSQSPGPTNTNILKKGFIL